MILKRNIYGEFIGDAARREIAILVGPRQVGKTTLLKEIERHFILIDEFHYPVSHKTSSAQTDCC